MILQYSNVIFILGFAGYLHRHPETTWYASIFIVCINHKYDALPSLDFESNNICGAGVIPLEFSLKV